ncbi:phage antirepressor N-terminal domain-containing protein [Streptomyces sp. NPDC004838]
MSPSSPEPREVVKLDLSAGSIHTVLVDGQPHVVLRPAVEDLGLDYSTQLAKLRKRSWAVVGQSPTTGADGKTYEMKVVPVRTFLMLLATINENRVAESVRPTLVAFQNETADAIEAYWTRGGAINPRAGVEEIAELRHQLDDAERARTAEARLSAMGVAKQFGLVNPSYIEAMARHELARMTGTEPDIDPLDVTITCEDFLTEAGVSKGQMRSARTRLGKTVAALYRARYERDPQKISRPVDGVFRDVAVYTQRDVDLFDKAWSELARHYDVQSVIALGGVA